MRFDDPGQYVLDDPETGSYRVQGVTAFHSPYREWVQLMRAGHNENATQGGGQGWRTARKKIIVMNDFIPAMVNVSRV
jgi:hypothetical protein